MGSQGFVAQGAGCHEFSRLSLRGCFGCRVQKYCSSPSVAGLAGCRTSSLYMKAPVWYTKAPVNKVLCAPCCWMLCFALLCCFALLLLLCFACCCFALLLALLMLCFALLLLLCLLLCFAAFPGCPSAVYTQR